MLSKREVDKIALTGCSPLMKYRQVNAIKQEPVKAVLVAIQLLVLFVLSGCGSTPSNFCDVSIRQSDETIIIGHLVKDADGSEYGAILVRDGQILDIGATNDIKSKAPDASVFDCSSSYISPGLINPHEHPDWSGGFPDPMTRPVYSHRDQWRGVAGPEYYAVEFERVEEDVQKFWIEVRHLLSGTTTLAGSGGVAGLIKNAGGRPGDEARYFYLAEMETFPYGFNATEELRGLSCPLAATESRDPRSRFLELEDKPPYVPHIAEGTNCTAEIEGKFYLDYVSKNPGRRYSLIHGVGLSRSDVERLKTLDVTLIWSPRSNVVLYGTTVDIPNALRAGARIAISTDWSYSGSYNLLEEFRCAENIDNAQWDDHLSGSDYWRMATEHGAYSLGVEKLTGKLEQGLAADIMIFRKRTNDPFGDLVSSEVSDVIATFVDGELLSGYSGSFDLSKLPAQCSHRIGQHFICVDYAKDYSFSHEELLSSNKNAVPLFSPDRQASCE